MALGFAKPLPLVVMALIGSLINAVDLRAVFLFRGSSYRLPFRVFTLGVKNLAF